MPTQVVEAHSDVVVISKEKDRIAISWVMAIAAIAVFVGVVFGYYTPNPDTKSPEFIGAGVLMEVILVSLAFYAAGPCELRLDPHKRRYRYLSGLPLLARTVEGPYTDIAVMMIRPDEGSRVPRNMLEIEWTVAGRKAARIRSLNLTESYEMRDTLQNKASLTVVWKT